MFLETSSGYWLINVKLGLNDNQFNSISVDNALVH